MRDKSSTRTCKAVLSPGVYSAFDERIDAIAHRGIAQAPVRDGRRTERGTRVRRGRLHEELVEWTVTKDAAIGDAVQRHAAGHAQPRRSGLVMQPRRLCQQNLFEHDRA